MTHKKKILDFYFIKKQKILLTFFLIYFFFFSVNFWVKILESKKLAFFLIECGSRCHSRSKKNHICSHLFSPYQASICILGLIIASNSKNMNFEEGSYFSNVGKKNGKKFRICGKDSSVKNSRKNIRKNTKYKFFSKKK